MEYIELVRGVEIPILGLGTWEMGGRQSPDYSQDEREIRAIKKAIELGMTHIDTAERYADGHAEELVREAIKGLNRDDLFITTKVWHNHLRQKDLIDSMKASLTRLDLDYVDLFLIHWPNPEIPLKETMGALELCVDEGWTRFIGVSNFSANLFDEAQGYLKGHKLVANQVEYNLLEQKPRNELLPYLRESEAILIAYSPLAQGKLVNQGNEVLDTMAEKYNKTRVQVALNWLINQEKVITIPKSSNPFHLEEIVGAVGWKLNSKDMSVLTKAFPIEQR
jgi:diketogulonate reductase-like aldo/keto reductase